MIRAALLAFAGFVCACQDPQTSPPEPEDKGSMPDAKDPAQTPKKDPDESKSPENKIECDQLVATGNDPGEIPVDLIRMASSGSEVSLRDYCNAPLLVMSGTAYCSN